MVPLLKDAQVANWSGREVFFLSSLIHGTLPRNSPVRKTAATEVFDFLQHAIAAAFATVMGAALGVDPSDQHDDRPIPILEAHATWPSPTMTCEPRLLRTKHRDNGQHRPSHP